MAGFAVMIGVDAEADCDEEFGDFLELAVAYKSLEKPDEHISGEHCFGAKLDFPASLHKGIIVDRNTDSWLIAAGTVVDTR